jgi:hypothetical protein
MDTCVRRDDEKPIFQVGSVKNIKNAAYCDRHWFAQ